MIYFLYHSYEPNTATYNRVLAFLRNIDEMEIPIKVVFLMPNKGRDRISDSFKYINVQYYWDHYYFKNKYLKLLSLFIYQNLFLRGLKAGDKVCIFGLDKIMTKILLRKDVSLFLESTECPEVYGQLSKLYHTTVEGFVDACRKAKALFVISSNLKEYYTERGCNPDNIHIINMTVDPKRFEGLNKQDTSERYIAYCGTASNNKDGVDKLIRSFGIVAKRHPDVKLYIIGDTPSVTDKTGNLELIKSLQIEEKVVFTGRVKAEEMPMLLKNAEVLALARPDNKQAKYGFPTKLGEYLLTGNPVVVTSVGDIPNFLKDGISALIAPADNDEIFAEKLNWALGHPEESKMIGERGKQVAMDSFNAAVETKKMMDVICES